MQTTIPNLENANDEQKKIYHALDNLLENDIIICKNNNVLLRFRLGDKTLAEYPIHCDVVDNEVIISKYAESKSN